jgi:hypothetical protein
VSAPARRARGFILLTVVLALTLVAAVAFLLNRTGGMNMSMAARGLEADRARYVAEAGLAQINYQTQNRNCTGYTDRTTTAFGTDSFTATVTPKAGSPVTFAAIGATTGGAAATLTRSSVATYAALSSATLQSADSTGIDTTLDSSNVTYNYGAKRVFSASNPQFRALLQFVLSGIPVGSRISSATLQLYRNNASGGGGSVSLYRVTTLWTEGTETGAPSSTGATYNTTNGIVPWSSAGGDYDPAAIANVLSNANPGWKSWDATSLVQGWVDLKYANYGMILIPTGGGGGDYTSSDDAASQALHPQLLISYYPRCSPTGLP